MIDGFISISDLFGRLRDLKPGGKALNERSSLIKFFYDQKFTHRDGARFSKQELGVRCAHLKLSDLYYIQSVYKDKMHRGENAVYYFMGATKTKSI